LVFTQERCSIKRYSQEVVGENKRDESAFSPYELYVLSFDFGCQKASDDILPLVMTTTLQTNVSCEPLGFKENISIKGHVVKMPFLKHVNECFI
jgi:hypothetical protein